MNQFTSQLYKKLFIEKISKHACFVKYKVGGVSFEKPFKLAIKNPSNDDLQTILDSPSINLIDCVSGSPFTLYFNDLLMFYIQHEGDVEKSEQKLKETLDEYQSIFSQLKHLKGEKLHNLFFRADVNSSKNIKIKNIKILDSLKLDELDDYIKLTDDNEGVVNKLRDYWKSLIVERYNNTIKSIDDEIAGISDESIKLELQSIKDILGSITNDCDVELPTKKTVSEILEYWPTLLLPRSYVFDVT